MEALQYKEAYGTLMELIGAGNKYIDSQAPWALNKNGDKERLGTVMRLVLEVSDWKHPADSLSAQQKAPSCWPDWVLKCRLLPKKKLQQSASLNGLVDGASLEVGEPLFPRIPELPESISKALSKAELSPKTPKAPQKEAPKAKEQNMSEETATISFEDFTKVQISRRNHSHRRETPQCRSSACVERRRWRGNPRTVVAGITSRYAPGLFPVRAWLLWST